MKKLLLQALGFFGISGIGWLMDFAIFTVLGFLAWTPVEVNNMISSGVGVTFVFIFSTRKLFQNTGRIPLPVKYLIYIVYQILLISAVSVLVGWLSGWLFGVIPWEGIARFSPIIAKILITPFTMVLNFIFMKILIEKVGKA